MKKFLFFALMAVVLGACSTNNPEKNELIGKWSEPYHVKNTVRSITFDADGYLNFVEKMDTTWEIIPDWGGIYAKMKYSVKKQRITFSGYYLYINENARRDSMFYTFVSGYSVNDNMLTIDSFSCDGGIMTPYIKPLTLYKQ